MAKTKRRGNRRVRRTRRGGVITPAYQRMVKESLSAKPKEHDIYEAARRKASSGSVKPTIQKPIPAPHDPYTLDQHKQISHSVSQYERDRKSENQAVRAQASQAHQDRVNEIKKQRQSFMARMSTALGFGKK